MGQLPKFNTENEDLSKYVKKCMSEGTPLLNSIGGKKLPKPKFAGIFWNSTFEIHRSQGPTVFEIDRAVVYE